MKIRKWTDGVGRFLRWLRREDEVAKSEIAMATTEDDDDEIRSIEIENAFGISHEDFGDQD